MKTAGILMKQVLVVYVLLCSTFQSLSFEIPFDDVKNIFSCYKTFAESEAVLFCMNDCEIFKVMKNERETLEDINIVENRQFNKVKMFSFILSSRLLTYADRIPHCAPELLLTLSLHLGLELIQITS